MKNKIKIGMILVKTRIQNYDQKYDEKTYIWRIYKDKNGIQNILSVGFSSSLVSELSVKMIFTHKKLLLKYKTTYLKSQEVEHTRNEELQFIILTINNKR